MFAARGLLLTDIVAKVGNRTTLKISRKLIFGTSLLLRPFSATAEVRG